MRQARIRALTILGLLGALIGSCLLLVGLLVGATTTSDATGTHVTAVGNPALFAAGLALTIAAGIVAEIAWIFALIRTAQLQRWGWFVTMLVIGSVVTLIWSLGGPDTPAPPLNVPSS